MDSILHTHFECVEAALSTLVDSIATYNPSPQAALDLIVADDGLSSGLDQLSHHQANHARTLALRAEAEALEAQLKTSVSTLATLRQQLSATPTTTFSEASRPVAFDQLLHYAKTISRYTVPPTYREEAPKSDHEAEKDKDKDDHSSAAHSNGITTPAIAQSNGGAEQHVTVEQAEWLRKLGEHGHAWVPWPDEYKIRRGNLMMIQHLVDQKKDPWVERVSTLEGLQTQQQEPDAQVEAQSAAPEPQISVRRETMVPSRNEPQEVKQFTGFDFDDDF